MVLSNLHCFQMHPPLSEVFHPVSLGSKLCPVPEQSEHLNNSVNYEKNAFHQHGVTFIALPTFCFEGVSWSSAGLIGAGELSSYASNLSSQWVERKRGGTKVVGGLTKEVGGLTKVVGGLTKGMVAMGGLTKGGVIAIGVRAPTFKKDKLTEEKSGELLSAVEKLDVGGVWGGLGSARTS